MRSTALILLLGSTVEAQIAKFGQQRGPSAYVSRAPQPLRVNYPSLYSRSFSQVYAPVSYKPQERMSQTAWAEAAEPSPAKKAALAKTESATKKEEKEEAPKSKDPVNVFGGKIASCGSDDECEYDGVSAQICVSLVPYNQNVFWNGMPGKDDFRDGRKAKAGTFVGNTDAAGLWKQAGKCMSLYEVGAENMIWTKDSLAGKWTWIFPFKSGWSNIFRSFKKRITYGFLDDVVVCDAVPSSVLDSEFSINMWNNCELEVREYDYAISAQYQTKSFIEKRPNSRRCQHFREAIVKVCSKCADQATDAKMTDALKAKCDAIGASAAFASEESSGSRVEYFIGLSLASFAGAFIGLGLHVFRTRRAVSRLQEPILQA